MDIKRGEKVLKALANRRRLLILHHLKKNRESPVGRVASTIRLSFAATSRHLAILAAADIVEKEQRSLEMFYYITPTLPQEARHIVRLL